MAVAINACFCFNLYAAKTNYVSISEIKAVESQAYLYINGLVDSNNCGSSTLVRFYWSTHNADKLWAMILSAQMANKMIAFDGKCVGGSLSLSTIYLKS